MGRVCVFDVFKGGASCADVQPAGHVAAKGAAGLPGCDKPAAPPTACSKYLRRPVVVNIGTAGKATDNVTQRVIVSGGAALAAPAFDAAPAQTCICSCRRMCLAHQHAQAAWA